MASATAQGYRAPLARDDFERMYAAGLSFVRIAYDDYAEYVRKHQPECWRPHRRVLDPFRVGQMAHAWDVEDELAAVQRDRFERGLPLLKARAGRADLLDFEGAEAEAKRTRRDAAPEAQGANAVLRSVLARVGAIDADDEGLAVTGLTHEQRIELVAKLGRAIQILSAPPHVEAPAA